MNVKPNPLGAHNWRRDDYTSKDTCRICGQVWDVKGNLKPPARGCVKSNHQKKTVAALGTDE